VEEFAANLAELFEVDKTTIHRRLRLLEQKGQIYCEVRERQRAPWRIILTGLANPLDEDDCGTTAAHEGRPMQQSVGRDAAVGTAENPAPQAGPSLSPVQSLSQSSDPTNEPNLAKPLIEGEKLDHLGVETTADEPEFDEAPRLDEREQNPFHAEPFFDASIGTAPLGELRRRHESGEL
jgi:hypothetical protein